MMAATRALSSFFSPHTGTSSSSSASGSASVAADTECSAETTVTPSGTISCACSAAEPWGTPSSRVALPETAAASGTVASTRIWPGAQRLLEVGQVLRLGAEGHGQEHDRPARGGVRVLGALDVGALDLVAHLAPRPPRPGPRRASRSPRGGPPGPGAAPGPSPARRCRRRSGSRPSPPRLFAMLDADAFPDPGAGGGGRPAGVHPRLGARRAWPSPAIRPPGRRCRSCSRVRPPTRGSCRRAWWRLRPRTWRPRQLARRLLAPRGAGHGGSAGAGRTARGRRGAEPPGLHDQR